ncbi:GNAT family N-acetyltransferase [Curtobacterium sp. VKM Ac-2861]|uniref:GNAT family N-acetyltransferase n=1 Tax=unclassified Curtobacterium TaxID=257496 RepID=UPI000FA0F44E|nr:MULTISPECIES: GNAT family N-acetyltransferase [unclassified Curtobacterium]NQW90448.1 GNAT family N-acetyltransferase [Curtobacterium sp. VKM Ac-2861]ROS47382.1 putative N-acetyltransferase YhbS [Curtobacterium sp. PhB78]TDW71562.1 putative N-acetyltransferase YhbS [Curtobacterium sp. PhB25]
MDVTLRNSIPEDIEWLVELRAQVLRADLERLGRFDAVRVRGRMRDAFAPEHTRVVVVDGRDVGSIATRIDDDTRWVEHFYLAPDIQGRGIGSTVLRTVLSDSHTGATRLNVLQGSPARRLYERHGFVVDTEDDVDVFMTHRHV